MAGLVVGMFSPHARGWPAFHHPTDANGYSSPRTRGDGPTSAAVFVSGVVVLPARAGMARIRPSQQLGQQEFSPHARGWPEQLAGELKTAQGSPRTRGDGPSSRSSISRQAPRSPRTRGDGPTGLDEVVQPNDCSPRTRGDGPILVPAATPTTRFSPHARGWPGTLWSSVLV